MSVEDITFMPEKPWLILTLRRTGGTSLTSALSKASSFPTIEHEPFNFDRLWGDVSAGFCDSGQVETLNQAIAAKLQNHPNIKHCFEFLPTPITLALITQAQRMEYHIILLTRRDEAKRQLSLSLALATDAWGAKQAAKVYPRIKSGEHAIAPIDLQKLRNRVQRDYRALGKTLIWLRNRKIPFDWLLFEELYQGTEPLSVQVCDLAARIGISLTQDDPRLAVLAKSNGQKSIEIAEHIPNYKEVVTLLERICPS